MDWIVELITNHETALTLWLGALCTLGIFSLLYKENPYYRLCEHIHRIVDGAGCISDLGQRFVSQMVAANGRERPVVVGIWCNWRSDVLLYLQ